MEECTIWLKDLWLGRKPYERVIDVFGVTKKDSIWEVFAGLLHSPSKKETGLPAHQLLSQPLKWNAT